METPLGYLPRLVCLGWDHTLLWLQTVPDILMICALFVLCFVLLRAAVTRIVIRADVAMLLIYFSAVAVLLGIVLNYSMGILTLWFPWYEAQATIKLVTTVVTIVGVTIIATTLSAGLKFRAAYIDTILEAQAPPLPVAMTQQTVEELQSLLVPEEVIANPEKTQQIISDMTAMLDEKKAKSDTVNGG